MKDNQKVLYNFSIIGFSSITNLLLPILLIPHFINKLGIELYGTVALAQSIMSYMNVIVEYHFSTITVKEIAVNRNSHDVLNAIFCRTLSVRLLLLLICLLLVAAITFLYPPFTSHVNVIFFSCMIIIGQSILPNWFLIAMEEVLAIAILNIVFKVIYIYLALTLIVSPSNVILPNFFLGLTNTIAGIIGITYIFKKYKFTFKLPHPGELFREIRVGYLMTVSNIATSIYNSGSPLILALFCSPKIVGEYTAAERILGLFRNVLAVYFQATYPRAAKIMSEGKVALKRFYRDTFSYLFAGVVLGSAVLFFATDQIMSSIFRISSPVISEYVRLLMGIIIINCMNVPFYQRLLLTDARKTNLIVIPGCFLSIVLNFTLIPYWGPYGCIISMTLTELFILGSLYYANLKYNLI